MRALQSILTVALLLLWRFASAEEPTTLVILGASGDLTARLLMPSLSQLSERGHLPPGTRIVGVAPPDQQLGDDASFRTGLKAKVAQLSGKTEQPGWEGLSQILHHQAVDLTSAASVAGLKQRLAALDAQDRAAGTLKGNRRVVFYFALPPKLFGPTLNHLHREGLIGKELDNDVVIEKPIGVDAETARQLNDQLERFVGERHTYRMDHYLGKSNIRALVKLRLSDGRFKKVWNKKYIDRIDIHAEESIGIEGRGNFYEQTGAARDMVQSHLLQVASLAAMDTPRSPASDDVREAKIEFLESIEPMKEDRIRHEVVRGQYKARGKVGGYLAEPGVAADSQTETYVAMRLKSARGKMKGVPIHIVAGKALGAKNTEVLVHFKRLPVELAVATGGDPARPATLKIGIAPTSRIELAGHDLGAIDGPNPLEPCARQLLDVLRRDQSMFLHRRESEAGWKVIDPMERAWAKAGKGGLNLYGAGTRGPKAARRFIQPARVGGR